MKNDLSFYFSDIKKIKMEENDFFIIYFLIDFLIKNKKNFLFETRNFLNKINFSLKNLKSENLKNLIDLFFKKEFLKIKSIYILYDKIFVFLLTILKAKKKEIFLLNTTKKFEKKDLKIFEENIFKYIKNSFLVIQKVDSEIYSGFQIYSNEKRNDFSWRRILNELLKKIEKDYFEEKLNE